MTTTTEPVNYDPFDVEINADPYPTYRRLREEAPIYRNDAYDFWALSRHADVERGLVDWETFSSSRGGILEIIQANIQMPPGVFIFEDPPIHAMHRGLLSRVFTPRKMNALEPQVRAYCAQILDPLIGSGDFDFVVDLGKEMPMRVIGMLLGIPDSLQPAVRAKADADLRVEPGKPMQPKQENFLTGELFEEYLDWRKDNLGDDVMSDLMRAEFEDVDGVVRKLTREEMLIMIQVIAGAGNETTTRLIGWLGKVLAEHPDQRAEIVADRSLIPNTIEETLRFEPTGPHIGRYVMRDVEYYGQTVPAGSAMLLVVGAANRDERRYPNPDRFDIHREMGQHLTFGYGIHYCLGAALARLEGRIALDEVLDRWPEWEVDMSNAVLSPTSTVRGWESVPATVPT